MVGGEGFIDVFPMADPDHYRLLDRIPTAVGARTGYYGKHGEGFDRFFLAVPGRGGQSAEIRTYTVQDQHFLDLADKALGKDMSVSAASLDAPGNLRELIRVGGA